MDYYHHAVRRLEVEAGFRQQWHFPFVSAGQSRTDSAPESVGPVGGTRHGIVLGILFFGGVLAKSAKSA
jgi:hypothetical protein